MRKSKNKIQYKTLEELILMTESEIMNHRGDILTNSDDFHKQEECTDKRYTDELEFYTEVRFKDTRIKMQQEWKENPEYNSGTIKRMSHEALYKLGLSVSMPEDGKFIFITPMPEPEGTTIKEVREFNELTKN